LKLPLYNTGLIITEYHKDPYIIVIIQDSMGSVVRINLEEYE